MKSFIRANVRLPAVTKGNNSNRHRLPSQWGLDHKGALLSTYIQNERRYGRGSRGSGGIPLEIKLPGYVDPNHIFQVTLLPNGNVDFDLETLIAQCDVLLTTYSILMPPQKPHASGGWKSKKTKMLKILNTLHWHRIVLDECQEIKSAKHSVAKMCAGLKSKYRWMVSGTPLCSRIEDLHGELNFLNVWPFSLPENMDGFWSVKIGKPFLNRDRSALKLLHALLDAAMMRHSKNQRYLDGTQLVNMPDRTIEFRGLVLQHSHEVYIKRYMENFACAALDNVLRSIERIANEMEVHFTKVPLYKQIQSLVSLLSRSLSFVSTIPLHRLDILRRSLCNATMLTALSNAAKSQALVPVLPPDQVLAILQTGGRGASGEGFNYANNRNLASTAYGRTEEKLRNEYEVYPLSVLKEKVTELGVSLPITWVKKEFLVSVEEGLGVVTCYVEIEEEEEKFVFHNC